MTTSLDWAYFIFGSAFGGMIGYLVCLAMKLRRDTKAFF